MRQALFRRSHSVLGSGGRPLPTASRFLPAVPLASFSTSFSSSSSAPSSALPSSSKPPHAFQRISPEELSKLNQTSVGLYRLLLKECLRLGDSADGNADTPDIGGDSPCFLLQESVNTDEFGKIRPFMNDRNSNDIQQDEDNDDNDDDDDDDRAVWSIISFFLQNLQRTNGSTCIQSKSDVLSKLDDSLFYADHLGDSSVTDTYSRSPRHRHLISTTPAQLVHAVRTAFFRIHDDGAGTELAKREMTKGDIIALHRRAIDAVSMLHAQKRLMDCTSVGLNMERGVRVTATSKFKSKGLLSRGAGLERNEEHFFVYRIRIECIGVNGSGKGKPIQLLGRKWIITDGIERKYQEHTGIDDDNYYGDDDHEEPDVQVVDAPRTGVVGYHPILHPGDAFEYTSGCNLRQSVGKMEGSYVFCEIEEEDIEEDAQKLGRIGDDLPAFKYEEDGEEEEEDDDGGTANEDRFFEVPVAPFVLDASK